MRTLKKALSLVLVLAMVLSLGVSAFAVEKAADYSDYADVKNTEAVAVLTALKVLEGNDDGTFGPEGAFTRAAAAKIIAYMTLGATVADALPASATKFSDVPATHWASKYIQYCADEGIILGNGDGTFGPDAVLTATAWAKMLLCALDYDAAVEGLTGTGWEIATTRLAMKAGVASAEDLAGTFNRDAAAKLAFNTLKANVVEYETSGTSITIGDTTINTGASKATAVENAATTETISDDNKMQFAEQHFPKLVLTANGTDAMKHPANVWTNNGKEVGTFAKAASKVVVATKAYAGLMAAYIDNVDKNANASYTVPSQSINGRNWEPTDATAGNYIAAGDVIEYYLTDGVITTAITTRYAINKITDVSTTLTKAQKETGATCKVQINGRYYLDTEITGFNADTYVKNAYVLNVVSGTKVIASEIAESVTGTVSATKNGQASIDGKYYTDTTGAAIGDTGTFYLGKAGQIMAKEASSTTSNNYAYIYNVTVSTAANADGVKVPTATVYYVTVDGTKASAVAKTETDASHNIYLDDGKTGQTSELKIFNYSSEGNYNNTSCLKTGVVAFSVNSDGKFVYNAAQDAITNAASTQVDKTHPVVGNGKTATDDTVFVFVSTDTNGVYKTSVVTGYKNVNIASASTTYLYTVSNTQTNKALYTFVTAANGNVTTTKDLAVLLSTVPTVTKNSDNATVYTYDVVINGEASTLSFKDSEIAGKFDGMVFAYTVTNGYATLDTSVGSSGILTKATVGAAGSDYFVESTNYVGTGSAKVYTITVEFKNVTEYNAYIADTTSQAAQSVTVSEGATFDAGDWVYYTTSAANTANNVFVVEFVY